MFALRDKYSIAGIGWTEFSKKSGRTVRSLASEACIKATADAGLKISDIDGIDSYNLNARAPAIAVATETGVPLAGYAVYFLSGVIASNFIILSAGGAIVAGLAM